MEFTPKDIITILIFIALLYDWGGTQTGLKSMPQIVLILMGLCTFGLSILNQKKVFKVFFYSIFGLTIFTGVFGITLEVIDFFLPNRGKVEIDKTLYGTNGIIPISETILSVLMTIGLLLLYATKWKSKIKLERFFSLAFTVLTSIIWIVTEQ